MREILFRGKWTRNGKWIEGFYARLYDGKGNVSYRIYSGYSESDCGDFYPEWFEVDPSTIGQYTGLCDKNGKKIFEGDIVEYNTFDDFNCYSIVYFGWYKQDGSGGEYAGHECVGWFVDVDNFTCPDWAENDPMLFHEYLLQQNLHEVAATCEIIGNKWDTPELLEVVNE